MPFNYKPYPAYKDSGVEWLGQVPEHWDTSYLRYLFNFGKGLTITKANLVDEGIPCVSYGEVHSKFGFEVNPDIHDLKCVAESYLNTSPAALLTKGDFVFADTSEDLEGSGNFTQLTSEVHVFAGYHTIIARSITDAHDRFLAYLLDSQEFRAQIQLAVKGVKVFSITQAILRSAFAWLPSVDEQKQIASFLDQETSKIDTLIEKQQKLIELLKEKRQAVISHAVTKGLNPNAKMKDSGIQWLGEIPEHWNISKLKYLTNLIIDGAHFTPTYVENGVPFLRVTDLHNSEIDRSKVKFIPEEEHRVLIKRCKPEKGDLLLSKNGTIGLTKVIDWGWEFSIFVSLCLIKFKNDKFIPELFSYIFQSTVVDFQLNHSSKKTSVTNLHLDKIQELLFVVPSIDEQEKLVSFLDKKTQKIDTLIDKSQQAIELLKERKTALISAAVTGKIDVRNSNV